MKTKILFVIISFTTFCNAQIVNIPNANFKTKLLSASPSNTIAKDLSGNYIDIDLNNDNEIQNSEATQVSYLNISNSNILANSLIGLEAFTNLEKIICTNNNINSLNLTFLSNLKYVNCEFSYVSSINVQGLSFLEYINCSNNNISSLNIQNLTNLKEIYCRNMTLNSLNVQGLFNLEKLICGQNYLSNLNVQNLINLKTIDVDNANLSSLNVQGLINLEYLDCSQNNISTLNLQGLENLKFLYCNFCGLDNLNFQDSSLLEEVDCSNNNISSLNIQNLNYIESLNCKETNLSSLLIENKIYLHTLDCSDNQITSLDLINLPGLLALYCQSNLLTNLNANDLVNIESITCYDNLLTSIFIKNGKIEYLYYQDNPNLQYICADENQILTIQNSLIANGYLNCNVGSYCSFNPGGTFYTIQGNQKFDYNSNGCDNSDIIYPNLKCTITSGTSAVFFINSSSGVYNIPLQSGTHTVTPIIENPTYFNVSPTTFNVSFPSTSSPYIQDFCITANGSHNDLEVLVLPLTIAGPGFDATYKLIYKNKGTTTQTGSINFLFDDSVLDFVSSNPAFSSQSVGTLNWNFTNLLPFESREINFVLNLNAPTETPALNSGDLLNYTTSVNGQTDATPNDNTAILNQIVVNSYDPNDKTCLEGLTITPDMVGEYVHYLIRFENNGTANAQNIVVKDTIDINSFDINTLIPIKSSHTFETRISNTNKVEFIFQNINLPFDDANNDGYVLFKIKTKANLVVGNTFSNSANIYFDYNFPIITNNYTTTIQNTLGLQENDFDSDIVAYPNPVKDVLNFKTENNIIKIEIYDIAGRIISSNSIFENSIDLRELKTGNYILKLYTESGIINGKIVKE
jgi:Leucine-rich repeat (LRR) protein